MCHNSRVAEFLGKTTLNMSTVELTQYGYGEYSAEEAIDQLMIPDNLGCMAVWFGASLGSRRPSFSANRDVGAKSTQFAPKCGQCSECKSTAKQTCINQALGDKVRKNHLNALKKQ